MEIVKLKIKDLKPYGKNAKLHPQEQINQIKQSIKRFGMNDPIGIWGKENLIVEGHGRIEALKQLGVEEVECIRLDHLTDAERKEYTLIHNKTTMFSYQIKNSSAKGDNVLDIFGGSGTTLMACENLDRNCYTMELDPKYVDVIINRWEKYTGKKAELIEE